MINVTKSYFPQREKLDQYIDRIYASGWMTNNGKLLDELEQRLKEFLGVEYLVLVTNGTLALQVAYHVLGIKNEVITTPFSFVATTNSLLWENLTPVFVDIDPLTFNIDPSLIERAITPRTSAILAVHVFGNACDVERLELIRKKYNLKIVYDAAHAFDVSDGKSNVLQFGDASILSFHATKIFHTIEGGAIILHSEEEYKKAKLLINFGISDYDKVDILGINCKMNEFQAAMGLAVLDEFEQIAIGRKKVWVKYLDAFRSNPNIQLQFSSSRFMNNHSYFPIVFDNEATLLTIKKDLNLQNIFPRRYFYPSLNQLDYLEHSAQCPVSESLAKRILCLPIFPDLDGNIQDQIIKIIFEKLTQ
ncbi:MAG: DegT/DnrJ/EryC1/StrS family aminotransferase [Bacteroidales bacterium]